MIKNYFKLLRVPQWIKNIFIFVPILFAQQLFFLSDIITVINAFIAFCLASSSVYIMNDLVDIESDKQHPVKKNRPVASGKISIRNAIITLSVLIIIMVLLCIRLNLHFIFAISGYIVLNIAYSFVLKLSSHYLQTV